MVHACSDAHPQSDFGSPAKLSAQRKSKKKMMQNTNIQGDKAQMKCKPYLLHPTRESRWHAI
jgi:hypothetical protein